MDQPLLAPPVSGTRTPAPPPPLTPSTASWSRVIVLRSREIIIIFGESDVPRLCDRETSDVTLDAVYILPPPPPFPRPTLSRDSAGWSIIIPKDGTFA